MITPKMFFSKWIQFLIFLIRHISVCYIVHNSITKSLTLQSTHRKFPVKLLGKFCALSLDILSTSETWKDAEIQYEKLAMWHHWHLNGYLLGPFVATEL